MPFDVKVVVYRYRFTSVYGFIFLRLYVMVMRALPPDALAAHKGLV